MKFLSSEKLSAHKYKTPEGYLVCTDAILARTGKQTYRKSEVFADAEDDGEIEIDRKAEEVFSPETLASFENKPITVEHPDENVGPDNYNTLSVGFVRDVRRGEADGQEVMLGTLVITDAQTIEEIENGEHVELSCGYDCDIADEEHPQQKNIRGNHVALCEQGRAGIARIVDSVKDDVESDIEKLPTQFRKEMQEAKNKKAALVGILGQLQDLVDRAGDKKDSIKTKAEKILKDLKAEFNINENFIRLDSIEEEKFDINKRNKELKENFEEFKEERMKDTNVKKVTELKRGDKIRLSSGSKAEVINVDLYPSIGEAYVRVKELIEGMQNKGQKEIEYNMHVDINKRYEIIDSIKDNLEYKINGHNSYTGRYFVEYIDANSVKEAIKKYAKYIAISGEGLSNINIHSISPNDGYMRLYGKLNELLKTLGISIYDSKSYNDTKYGVIAKYKYLRGDTKGARIEYDVDYANELKQELENNDKIPYIVFEIKDSIKDDGFDILSSKYDIINRNNLDEFLKDFNRLYNRHLSSDGNDIVNEAMKDIYNIGKGAQVEYLISHLKNSIKDSVKDTIKDSLIGKRVKTIYGDGEVIDELYKAGLKQWRVKLDSGSFVDTTRVEYNGYLYTSSVYDSVKDVDPREGESKEDFISRFMSETKEEYPDEKQRLAVAYSYWKNKHTNDSKYTVRYTDNDVTYIHIVKAKSKLDAIKKIKK